MKTGKVKFKLDWRVPTVLIAAILVFGGARVDTGNRNIKSVEIQIDDEAGNFFITEIDVNRWLDNSDEQLLGTSLDKVDLSYLEDSISRDPYVDDVDVWFDIQGKLYVDITQKVPILRIINRNGVSYYVDENGSKLPLSHTFTSRVLVATGFLQDNMKDTGKLERPVVQQLYFLADRFKSDAFWNAQIEQINVMQNGDFELIPRLGEHTIVLGDTTKLDKKLDKLMLFYREGLKSEGWTKYKRINLKFDDQIVCTKR